jgi:hypothetical protein
MFRAGKHRKAMIAVVVYLGLLPSLLFSAGEGIRLIPFPELSPSSENPAEQYENRTRYHENTTRIFCDGAGQKNTKKLQDLDDCPGTSPGYFQRGPAIPSTTSSPAVSSPSIDISDRGSSGRSSRAPPLV